MRKYAGLWVVVGRSYLQNWYHLFDTKPPHSSHLIDKKTKYFTMEFIENVS